MAERKVQIVTMVKVMLIVSLALIAHYYPIPFIKAFVFITLGLWVIATAV